MPHAILIVDKPVGPTSHAVVAGIRRTLQTRAVGHAGTLDPAASGVLVVAIGEATKLVTYFASHPKRYLATVRFGASTTTCDAEGEIVEQAAVDDDLRESLLSLAGGGAASGSVAAAIEIERSRREQVPPSFSAIKVQGRRSYARARRGEAFELAPRAVSVTEIDVAGATEDSIVLSLFVSKGYYVRSLARDLGRAIGVPAHLSALRRTASGPFTLAEAIVPSACPEAIASALVPIASAAERVMPTVRLTDEGALKAFRGQALEPSHFVLVPPVGVSAWLAPSGELVAIGRCEDQQRFTVDRGFNCTAARI